MSGNSYNASLSTMRIPVENSGKIGDVAYFDSAVVFTDGVEGFSLLDCSPEVASHCKFLGAVDLFCCGDVALDMDCFGVHVVGILWRIRQCDDMCQGCDRVIGGPCAYTDPVLTSIKKIADTITITMEGSGE